MANVKVRRYVPVKGTMIFSTKRLPCGAIVSQDDPRDGFFHVIWELKPKKLSREVTGLFRSKSQADKLAFLLNAMTRRQAIALVKELHKKGGNDRSGAISKKSTYTGRSFAWPR